jgi:AP endonuclease-2
MASGMLDLEDPSSMSNVRRNPFSFHPWSVQKTFAHMFNILEADIVCLQETKIQKKDLTDDMVLVPGWDSYFTFPKHKKGD